MRNVLILAGDTPPEESSGRSGDLFDAALLEIVRALDVSGDIASVLVPWSDEFAALIAVAAADTAPSFDPESATERAEGSRSCLVPYWPAETSSDEWSRPFLDSSHLSLAGRTPVSLADALGKHPPQDLIVLSLPNNIAAMRRVFGHARVFVFGSLVSRAQVASVLDVQPDRVVDLEQTLRSIEDTSGARRSEVEGLEPFIPFGLLIQDVYDDILPDVDDRSR